MRYFAVVLVTLMLVGATPAVFAQGQGQGQGKGKPQAEQPVQLPSYDKDRDRDKGNHWDAQNHGQVVSECNHRANERNLKGQDRHDYVEWCTSRGSHYRYDYDRYGKEADCYRKANNKGLTGDKRRNFLDKCFDEVAHRFSGDGKRKKD